MCVAIPYKVFEIDDNGLAQIEIAGARHKVSLALVPEVKTGDWVLVNLGSAIAKIDEDEAREIISLYREIAAAETL
jgi:hydrogenase expression/formation protein HypC